ncbi:SDR family oxidoreductase [Variovorax sp. SRS16]|uniref:SDR family oxidoreductase n=1 Tax=Variovorax sp. SRS16 TaxID=282217 RepID=UPI001E3F5C27|nr:SDR family NAD(P)-dependent oxidoreductase [Variovorax sp. SRS16]
MPSSKIVVVTGAARGIGAAAALELARAGITPVLFVRSPEAARPVLDSIDQLGANASVCQCDVSSPTEVEAAMAQTLERHGRIDGIVNNAGQIDPIGRLAETDPVVWRKALEVNLLGAYHVARAAIPAMVAAKRGLVLNISSGAAHQARLGWSAYCSAKAGLFMLTRAIATEYAEEGIVAIGFQPGVVDTEMQSRIRSSGINEISRLRRDELAPADRAGRAIAWLCKEVPRQFNGTDTVLKDLLAIAGASEFIMRPMPLETP